VPTSSDALHNKITAPIAKKIPYSMEIHNHKRVDNYYWMRDDHRTAPEVLAHLNSENNYTEKMLAQQKPLQKNFI
jgi:oligopeptidase B